MKAICLLAWCLLCWSVSPLKGETVLRDGDLVAVCGDSITEQSRYSLFIQQYLMMCAPGKNLSALQLGWGGERAPGFLSRVDSHVRPFNPQVVTLCYGMNDGNSEVITDETRKRYRDAVTAIVKKLKSNGVRTIVVASPGVVDPSTYRRGKTTAEVYNQTLEELGKVAGEVAKTEGVVFADLHTAMQEAVGKAKETLGKDYIVAPDGIHPNPNGHFVMAYAILKSMGFDGQIGTYSVDFRSGIVEASEGHVIRDYKDGTLEIESSRYPYCFYGGKNGIDTLAMSAFTPFNQELNRLVLVVKNAPDKARVTWGTASRDYTGQELAQGVNLAADFLDNPFKAPFASVSAIMAQQQKFEALTIKTGLSSLVSFESVKGAKPHVEAIRKLVLDEDAALREASRAAIKPVVHKLKITAVP